MKTLIIQHEESTPAGSTLNWLKQRKMSFDIFFPTQEKVFPNIDHFNLIVICGGSMNVDQEDLYPWLKLEKEFIEKCIKAHKQIIGLCLGAQLVAEILGGKVEQLPHSEIGWHPVKIENEKSLIVFQCHSYGFTLPPNAKLLASNQASPCQGFTLNNNIIVFQFHPETTKEWALECANSEHLFTDHIEDHTGYRQTPEEIKRDITYQDCMQEWYFAKLDRLVSS